MIQCEKHIGTNVLLGYYDQEQSDLNSTKSVLAELWDDHSTTPEKDIRSILGSFLFSGEDVEKAVSSLSGGEKARLALAKLAMNKDNFLVLDEPTNHLDIDSKEVLENALIDFDGTLLFVSHDRYFINRIATTVVELSENGSTLYLGDYDYYLEKKAEQEELRLLAEAETVKKSKVELAPTVKANRETNKAEQKMLRQLTRRIESIESEMEVLETAITNYETQLIDPEVFGDHLRVQELNEEMTVAQEKLDNLVNEWEEKSLKLEELQ